MIRAVHYDTAQMVCRCPACRRTPLTRPLAPVLAAALPELHLEARPEPPPPSSRRRIVR